MYVELRNINKTFATYRASDHVSFGIEKGKLIGLLGPSGSGKTTILRMIAGLETPDSGDIFIDGKRVNDILAGKRGIGFVFQNYALFRYMTIYENIAFGLEIKKVSKEEIKERVTELIKLVGLEGLEKRFPHQLSGGQRQRVAFARALAPNPQLLLLDEPFAAIDAKVRLELRSWLRDMIDKLGITSIFVTHDQDEAIEVAHEIVILNEGKVEQKGKPIEVYKSPATSFVAQFIGQSSIITKGTLYKGFESVPTNCKAVVRPEFLSLYKESAVFDYRYTSEEGVVEDVFFRGSYAEVKVRVMDEILSARRQLEDTPIEKGESVRVIVHRMYAYDQDRTYVLENENLKNNNWVII